MIPLSVMSWQDAITGIYTGKMVSLHEYDNWFVRSQKLVIPVPAVCILNKQVKTRHRFSLEHGGGPQNSLVFLRDGYQCQYCHQVFHRKHLTVDHVIPKSKGGKRTWNNLSSACNACNSNRGTNEAIQPKIKPVRPMYDHLLRMARKFEIKMPHASWNYYIGWDEHLIKYVTPQDYHKEMMEE